MFRLRDRGRQRCNDRSGRDRGTTAQLELTGDLSCQVRNREWWRSTDDNVDDNRDDNRSRNYRLYTAKIAASRQFTASAWSWQCGAVIRGAAASRIGPPQRGRPYGVSCLASARLLFVVYGRKSMGINGNDECPMGNVISWWTGEYGIYWLAMCTMGR